MNTWHRLPISGLQAILILLISLSGYMMPAASQASPAQPGELYLPVVLKIPSVTRVNNGDFELGSNGDWLEYSRHSYPLIYYDVSLIVQPHSGKGLAFLGGVNDEESDLSQALNLSAETALYLKYYFIIDSEESACQPDVMQVLVNTEVIYSTRLCQGTSSSEWALNSISLSSYIGQTITLHFRVETDNSLESSFFLDDVALDWRP